MKSEQEIMLTGADWMLFRTSPELDRWYDAWEAGRLSGQEFVARLRNGAKA